MSRINKLLRLTAVAALLPLAAHAGTAFAGPAQTSSGRLAYIFGDPDSGGEVRGHGHGISVAHGSSPLADKDGVVVTGPGGTRPTMLAGDEPPIIRGAPPIRPNLMSVAIDGNGGGGVGGPGGTGKPIRPSIASLAMESNDGGTVSGPGGTGKPPIRPTVVASASAA